MQGLHSACGYAVEINVFYNRFRERLSKSEEDAEKSEKRVKAAPKNRPHRQSGVQAYLHLLSQFGGNRKSDKMKRRQAAQEEACKAKAREAAAQQASAKGAAAATAEVAEE